MKKLFTLMLVMSFSFGYSQIVATETAPYFENFDANFNPGSGTNNAGSTIDSSWYRNNLPWGTYTEYAWGGGTGQASSQNTGPTSDHTSGSGNYAYAESSAYDEKRAKLSTPLIDLDTLSNPQLTFWKHQFGADIKSFSVQLVVNGFWYGTKYNSVGNKGNQWDKVTIPLDQYVGQTVSFIFVAWRNTDFPGNGLADIAIDDIEVNNVPNCPTPSPQISDSTSLFSLNYDASGSTGLNLSYDWTFGDGNTATGVTGNYTYTNPGVYNLSLKTTDACGQISLSTKTVTICDTMISAFSYTTSGSSLTFDASNSTAVGAQYLWDFGDGTTGTGKTVSHTYSTTGNFNVVLTVTDLCGQTYSLSDIISSCGQPEANWSYNIVSTSSAGMTVQFFGQNSIGAQNYFWDFGDGITNSTSALPSHTYSSAGLFYVVTLIVTNDCGNADTLQSSLQNISVDELVLESIKTYPNPSQGELKIELGKLTDTQLNYSVFGLGGQLLLQELGLPSNGILEVDLNRLNSGVYILRLETSVGLIQRRISIQK